jgi:cytochrome b pre-mRNA-processing protein 3
MLGWLKRRRNVRRTARSLYGSIVTQARSHLAYERWGVPDTPEGRFEMIVLHLALVLRRLSKAGEAGRKLGQALTEVFVVDVDDTLREMTVGDLSVPRHVKRAVIPRWPSRTPSHRLWRGCPEPTPWTRR